MLHIVTVYGSPIRNFIQFTKGTDNILNYLSKSNTDIILCGDINANYLTEDCSKRQQLNNLLATYNLVSKIEFPNRIAKDCASAIDDIHIDKTYIGSYTVSPLTNGL
jgi:exonuclease III